MTQTVCQNDDENILRVFWVRHGQTDHNVKKILQGHADIDLNDKGWEQAALVGAAFSKIDLDAIVSSDLIRCQNTTKEIVKQQSKPIEPRFTYNLRECYIGVVQGMYLKDAVEKYGVNLRELGEGSEKFKARLIEEWRLILKQHSRDKNVLLCTHGGVLTTFIKYLHVNENYQLREDLKADDLKKPFNTSVTIVDVHLDDISKSVIQMFGNTDHLGANLRAQEGLLI